MKEEKKIYLIHKLPWRTMAEQGGILGQPRRVGESTRIGPFYTHKMRVNKVVEMLLEWEM